MPFIDRDENGKIRTYPIPQYEGQEFLPDDNEEILNFGKPSLKERLENLVYEKKKAIAYGGYRFEKNGNEYYFGTSKEDLGLVLSTVMAFNNNSITSVNWKCNGNKFVQLDKTEFLTLFSQGTAFVNAQFDKEKLFLEELNARMEIGLSDEWVTNFRLKVEAW